MEELVHGPCTMGRRTKVRICQQAVLPAIIRFREGRRARVECPRAVVDFCVYLRVSLAASNKPGKQRDLVTSQF